MSKENKPSIPSDHIKAVQAIKGVFVCCEAISPNELRRRHGLEPWTGEEPPCEPNHVVG